LLKSVQKWVLLMSHTVLIFQRIRIDVRNITVIKVGDINQ
jgi:hypothetical protein